MIPKRVYFLTLLGFVFCASASAESLSSLRSILNYAVEKSPSIKINEKELSISKMKKKNSYWQMFPSVDLKSVNGVADNDPRLGGEPWTSQSSVGLSANIYNNNRDYANYEIATLRNSADYISYIKERNQIILNIIHEYYTFSRLLYLKEIREQKYEILKNQFSTVDKSYKSGARSRRDYLRFKAQLRRSEVGVISVGTQLAQSKLTFKKLIGMGETDELKALPEEISFIKVLAIKEPVIEIRNHYDYRLAEIEEKVQQSNHGLKKRLYYPEVFLDGSYNYNYSDYLERGSQGVNGQAWNVLLTLKYNLFDGGRRRRDLDIASLQLQVTSHEKKKALLSSTEVIESLKVRTKNLLSDLKLNKELLDIETRSFDNIRREYRNGQASYLDFITGLNDLLDTKSSFQSSYFSYMGAIASLKFHKGSIYEEFIQH